jgi:twitching motility protein PilT
MAETSAGAATTAETAVEVMVATSAVRNLIREGKTFQIPNVIQTGSQHGMQSLDQALAALCRANVVTPDEALARCTNPEEFKRALGTAAGPELREAQA